MMIFPREFCERVCDTICPAWRREVAAGDATVDHPAVNVWDTHRCIHVPNPNPPREVSYFQMHRNRGLVRAIVMDLPPWWHTSPTPVAPVDAVICVELYGPQTPIPGQGMCSTARNFGVEIFNLQNAYGFAWGARLGIAVGTQQENRALLTSKSWVHP